MAKVKGTEEFFEVFRTASQKPKAAARDAAAAPAAPGASADAAEPPRPGPAADTVAVPPPASPEPPPPPTRTTFAPPGRTLPFSVFADDEPTISVRRSTVVFAVLIVAVLLFIFYALGKRAGRNSPAVPTTQRTIRDRGLIERARPAIPDDLRKWAACMKVLDHTQTANLANARAYCAFFNTAPQTRFIRQAGKRAFIVSRQRKLHVCIGPFDACDDSVADRLLPKLQALPYEGVQRFARASLEFVGNYRYAKLIE